MGKRPLEEMDSSTLGFDNFAGLGMDFDPLTALGAAALGLSTGNAKKAPRTSPRDGDWTCAKCQNMNYADRIFCNMRKCGAPRPADDWICSGCGNSNYANRMFCNMRRCRQPRGDLGTAASQQALVLAQNSGMAPPSMACGKGPGKGSGGKGRGEGDWICSHCQNVNFADRAFCNMRRCGAPRMLTDWVCTCGNTNYADRTVCNMRKCGAVRVDINPKVLEELIAKGLGKGPRGPRQNAAEAQMQIQMQMQQMPELAV